MTSSPHALAPELPMPVTGHRLDQEIARLPDWRHHHGTLLRAFTFPSISPALVFASHLQDTLGHLRPEAPWMVVANQVLVHLSTRETGGQVSDTDLALAHLVERTYRAYIAPRSAATA